MDNRTQQPGVAYPNAAPTVIGGTRTQMAVAPQLTVHQAIEPSLAVECLAGNSFALASESSREHALVLLKAQSGVEQRSPINICLCIDRSGSMEGEPMEYVKRACDHVVDMLGPNDILSIVTFEEQVDVLMPARRVVNKPLVKEHIHRLDVGNTTNLYDGLVASCMQIASVMPQTPGYVHRVLLLTDGEPTAGLKDFSSIVQQVSEQKQRGISITALGFGSDYNEELMAGIARRSGGNYYYIQRPDLLPEVFRKELETLISIVAKNVRVRFHLSRWSQVRQVYALQPAFGPRAVEVAVPDIERGTLRTVLAELEFDRHPAASFRVARIEVIYDDVASNGTQTAFADCVLEFTDDRNRIAAGINPMVHNELEVALASQNLQRTMMGMRTQQMTASSAMQELQKTRTVLMSAGQGEGAREVEAAMRAVQSGADIEKTIVGTIFNLDQGKRS
jgi:Ca-activated chloride channel family protein